MRREAHWTDGLLIALGFLLGAVLAYAFTYSWAVWTVDSAVATSMARANPTATPTPDCEDWFVGEGCVTIEWRWEQPTEQWMKAGPIIGWITLTPQPTATPAPCVLCVQPIIPWPVTVQEACEGLNDSEAVADYGCQTALNLCDDNGYWPGPVCIALWRADRLRLWADGTSPDNPDGEPSNCYIEQPPYLWPYLCLPPSPETLRALDHCLTYAPDWLPSCLMQTIEE